MYRDADTSHWPTTLFAIFTVLLVAYAMLTAHWENL